MAKETIYSLDYPNWEINKVEKITPYNADTRSNHFPFFSQPVNADYGSFYSKGIKEN